MSLFTALRSTSNNALQIGTGLQYHSQNVSSANDPDYQRLEVKYRYNGNFVYLGTPERVNDIGISRELLLQRGTAGESDTLQKYLASLKGLLGIDGKTPKLTDSFERFVQSWRDLQASPDLDSAQDAVVNSGQNLADEISSFAVELGRLRNDANTNINSDIRDANSLLREIGRLNARIANAKAQDISTGVLENERDTALNELSTILAVQTSTNESGVVSVYSRTGHLLLGSSGQPRELAYNSGTREITIGDDENVIADNDRNLLSNGSLKAHFNLIRDGATNTQNRDDNIALIAKYELILDNFVEQLTSSTDITSFNEAFERNSGTPPFTFFNADATARNITVNSDLRDGINRIPIDTVQTDNTDDNVIDVLGLETRNITNTNLTATLQQTNKSYTDLANGIISLLGQTINRYDSLAKTDGAVRDGLKEQLVNRTGVNSDEELTHIQQLQTLYAANARIIATINSMFDDLFRAI
ncbi:MAG: flagellar hook-associated protein FlgK [Alphaproteobacteria bacterium]|nr:flagellar hook-associated protein FlgK [Alphaproteobacteria bacterium]